jgi:hypothetical protein
MRRRELLALRGRDTDLETGTLSVRRSAGMVRNAGESAGVIEGDTKSGKPRVIDLDDDAAAVLRTWRKTRGSMALQLITPDSLVFGDIEGSHRNPEHVSRRLARDIERVPGGARRRGGARRQAPRPAAHSRDAAAARPRAGARGQPVPRPRLARGHDDGLRPRAARQSKGSREHVRPAGEGGARSMSTRSVISVSECLSGANYKSLTCSDGVSEDRHAPYVHDRHRPDHGVSACCWRRSVCHHQSGE